MKNFTEKRIKNNEKNFRKIVVNLNKNMLNKKRKKRQKEKKCILQNEEKVENTMLTSETIQNLKTN